MSEALETCDQMTFEDTRSAISSPALEGGAERCGLRDGQTTFPFGQDRVPASRSARQGKVAGSQTSGICGRRGTGSSLSAGLESCLESKCVRAPLSAREAGNELSRRLGARMKGRLSGLGSTLFRMTWKEHYTPAGRLVPLLAASVRRTSDCGCGSVPTPRLGNGGTGNEKRAGNGKARLEDTVFQFAPVPTCTAKDSTDSKYTYNQGNHDSITLKLPGAVMLFSGVPTPATQNASGGARREVDERGWNTLQTIALSAVPSPNVRERGGGDYSDAAKAAARLESGHQVNLADVALSAVPTCAARDWRDGRSSAETQGRNSRPLNKVILASLPMGTSAFPAHVSTPRAEERCQRNSRDMGEALSSQVRLMDSGAMPSGSLAVTGSGVQLNPAYSRWLMGYPAAWDECSPGWRAYRLIQRLLGGWSIGRGGIESADCADMGTR